MPTLSENQGRSVRNACVRVSTVSVIVEGLNKPLLRFCAALTPLALNMHRNTRGSYALSTDEHRPGRSNGCTVAAPVWSTAARRACVA